MTKAIFIAGATATGKSNAAITLAKHMGNAEIISADSMQVYKHMNIGTAKITKDEMQGIPHHLIDILEPSEVYSVATFVNLANSCIEDITSRGCVPIICGGSGFYISALLYNATFDNEADKLPQLRLELEELAKNQGSETLHHMLEQNDPISAQKIGKNNTKRLIRAIEFFQIYNKPISEHNLAQKNRTMSLDARIFVLYKDRARLYQDINTRVDKMIADGLEGEVRGLLAMGYEFSLTSMQAIGYKEMLKYIMGEISKADAIELIKKNTRKFAKRQETWFKNQMKEVEFYESDTFTRCCRDWQKGPDS